MDKIFVKRRVPERLNLALEVCFQRDDVSPHLWDRETKKTADNMLLWEHGDLYCSTYLNDEEWKWYLNMAACEYIRATSACPGIPVLPKSVFDDRIISCNNAQKEKEIMRRLGAESMILEKDIFEGYFFEE